MRLAWAFVLAGCGRVDFDAVPDASTAPVVDGAPIAGCVPITCDGSARADSCNGRCITTCKDRVPYAMAAARCTAWGGTVMTIRDETDKACAVTHDAFGWLGFVQDPGSTGVANGWRWADGSPANFLRWSNGEPNDGDGTETGVEQCAHMYSNTYWNDRPCTSTAVDLVCSR